MMALLAFIVLYRDELYAAVQAWRGWWAGV